MPIYLYHMDGSVSNKILQLMQR